MKFLNHSLFFLFICLMIHQMYLMLFKEPREARKKAVALRARAKAQREGVDKMCDGGKKLRELMEEKGPLYPHDQEVQAVLKQIDEGGKQFRENSDPPAEEKK